MSGAGREPVPAPTTSHPGEPRGPCCHLAGSADVPVSSFQSICLSLNTLTYLSCLSCTSVCELLPSCLTRTMSTVSAGPYTQLFLNPDSCP